MERTLWDYRAISSGKMDIPATTSTYSPFVQLICFTVDSAISPRTGSSPNWLRGAEWHPHESDLRSIRADEAKWSQGWGEDRNTLSAKVPNKHARGSGDWRPPSQRRSAVWEGAVDDWGLGGYGGLFRVCSIRRWRKCCWVVRYWGLWPPYRVRRHHCGFVSRSQAIGGLFWACSRFSHRSSVLWGCFM